MAKEESRHERKERNKQEYLSDFLDYRNDEKYIDEIPKKNLTPENPNYAFYRCRDSFFTAIQSRIETLLNFGMIIGEDAVKECQNYINFVRQKNTPRTTKEDIQKAKDFLDFIIKYLEK